MELFEFTRVLKELTDYYERAKEPRHGTIELWFAKVKKIPGEPLPWIVSRIESENETFPKNLPGALWAFYREWLSANPDRVAHIQPRDCPDCTDGLLWATIRKNGIQYSYVFRCCLCRQSMVQAYPLAGRRELGEDGYQVMPKEGWPYGGSKPKNLAEAVGMVGNNGGEHGKQRAAV